MTDEVKRVISNALAETSMHSWLLASDVLAALNEHRYRIVSGSHLAALSTWIDEYPPNAERDGEAATWGRLAKVGEECGEVVAAYILATGQNPRKPPVAGTAAVRKELLDVAVTALAAHEHLTGNDGSSVSALFHHIDSLIERAGLTKEPKS